MRWDNHLLPFQVKHHSLDAGAKTYGKIGEKTSFGVLDANTFGESNALAASVSHKVNPNFGILSSVTSLDTPGAFNRTAGVNAWYSWGPNFSRIRYIGSQDSAQGSGHFAVTLEFGGFSAL